MALLAKYKFTNKKHPLKSVMAVILAVIGVVTVLTVIILAWKNGGVAGARSARALILAEVMALVGLVLAIMSRTEPDRYYFFPDMGIVLNALVLCAGAVILALGLDLI